MNDIDKAIKILKKDGVVAIPTETVYGLAGSVKSELALKKIFDVKERPSFDPLIIHVSNKEQAKELTTDWNKLTDFLADRFWPGPLTMVVRKSDLVSPIITAGMDSVGIRAPKHPLTMELIEKFGTPVAAPSANKFKKTSPTQASHVEEELGKEIFVLDGGECQIGIESTVARVGRNEFGYEIEIYRPGMITKEDLQKALEDFPEAVNIRRKDSPVSPGSMKEHYMPAKPFYILGEYEESPENSIELILPETPVLAARVLYQNLRDLSHGKHDAIFLRYKPVYQEKEWEALWDRLTKASQNL
jgi:L-threonylcarbamoyladenylate synthase